MRWLRALTPLLLLVGIVTGCTGTTENVPPLLLALGRYHPGTTNPEMVLLEDNYPNQPRFTVVPNSERSLPYAAVASDVVDRAGSRSTLVVLTRDLSGGTSPASALVTFQFSGINPSAPSDFKKSATIQLPGVANSAFNGVPPCFDGVSVSQSGQYVYLMDNPDACDDTSTQPARLFQFNTATATITEIVQSPMQPTTPLDDQANTGEKLYFLVSGTTYAQLYTVPVPYDPATDSPTPLTATLPGTDQLALKDNGSALVTITNFQPYGPPMYGVTSNLESLTLPPTGTPSDVPTADGARTLAVDPTGFTAGTVVAGYQQIFVHASPSDNSPATTSPGYGLTGVAAALDPINRFGYVIANGQIVLLDLDNAALNRQPWYKTFPNYSDPSPAASELQLPTDAAGKYVTTLSWTRARVPPP